MDSYTIAIIVSTVTSLLIAAIEILHKSGKNFRSLFTQPMALYTLILALGNVATTLLAASLIEGIDNANAALPGPDWFWFSFVGVFGFTAVIQNLNVTLFDKGVLSINEWISKAADNATAATISRSIDLELKEVNQLAARLKLVPESELNAHILQKLGPEALAALNRTDDATDRKLYKALTLADADPNAARAIVQSLRAPGTTR